MRTQHIINTALVERRIAELLHCGHSEKKLMQISGLPSLFEIDALSDEELLHCHKLLRLYQDSQQEVQLKLFDVVA